MLTAIQNTKSRGTRPIKVMAKRHVSGKTGPSIQYLVLWYSWENADGVLDTVEDMISDLHID